MECIGPMKVTTIAGISLAAAFPLLIPLIAMQFTNEVNWTAFDFVFAWVLLSGAGLAFVFIASRSKNTIYRAATGLTVLTALLLVWANGAVGLIGNEDNPANLLYGAVPAVLFLGSILVWFRARGMSYVVFAAALTQLLVPLVAFFIWQPSIDQNLIKVVAVSSFFAVLWAGAALLYRRAEA